MGSLTYEEAVNLAKEGKLPEGFTKWQLANQNNWNVAHVADDKLSS